MPGRRLAVLLVTLYVSLDFGNPLMPGAVTFEADDMLAAGRAATSSRPAPALLPSPLPERIAMPRAPEPRLLAAPAPLLPRMAPVPRPRPGHRASPSEDDARGDDD